MPAFLSPALKTSVVLYGPASKARFGCARTGAGSPPLSKALRPMKPGVVGRIHQLQVLKSVVGFDTVDVMHDFILEQRAAEPLSHEHPVFKCVLSRPRGEWVPGPNVDADISISGRCSATSPVATQRANLLTVCTAHALKRAVASRTSCPSNEIASALTTLGAYRCRAATLQRTILPPVGRPRLELATATGASQSQLRHVHDSNTYTCRDPDGDGHYECEPDG